MINTQEIREHAHSLGIDDLRITTAEPFPQAHARFQAQKNAGLFTKRKHRHFKNTDAFYNVKSVLPEARSVITACECYLTTESEDLTEPGHPYGRIARYTWRNYYKDLRARLSKLAQFMATHTAISYVVYSNGPVAEKPLAQRSGIGYYGKHSVILNPSYGSWIVLGEIITSVDLEPDGPLDMDCGDCRACMDACPTHAIQGPYIIDRTRCIQELTNWYGILPDDIIGVWGNRLYGCTTCQEVCPLNKNVKPHAPRTDIGYVGSCIPLFDILSMNETEYRKRFPNNQISASWINFKAIQRNALLALGCSGDQTAVPFLKKFLQGSDTVLIHTAQWALKRVTHA